MLHGEERVGILATAQAEVLMKSQHLLPNMQMKKFLSQRLPHVFSAKGQLGDIYIIGHIVSAADTQLSCDNAKVARIIHKQKSKTMFQ